MNVVVHDSLSKLQDSDIDAIAAYMLDDDTGMDETVEPAKVAVLTPRVESHGKTLYASHCSMCHQETGKGMPGKVPPLAGNPTVEASEPYNILSAVLGGLPARDGYLAMPSFANTLTNQDISDIANYVRVTWGNRGEADVTPTLVASWRSQVKPPVHAKAHTKAETSKSKTADKSKSGDDADKTANAGKAKASAAPAPSTAKKSAAAATAPAAAAAPPSNPLAKSKPYFIVSRDIIGLDVHSQDDYGKTLGTLAGLIIDSTTGQTVYAVIERGGFLGLGEYKVVVPFHLVQFTGQWDNPMLAMNTFKIENAPRITDDSIEDLMRDQDWRRSVAAYFGVALAQDKTAAKGGKETKVAKTEPAKTAAPKQSAAQLAAEKGKKIAATQCAACHHFAKGGGTLVGPDLYGVFGSKIASVPGYSFSSALKKHTGDWTAAKLNDWLKSPSTFAPGTYMTFPGLSSQSERDDVIAYLKSLE
jgi:cytochrome c2